MTHEADVAALLELHARDRRAHLEGNAGLLTSGMADEVWEASRGQLTRISRSELETRFAAYFESVRYSIWDDLQPPHVSVSADGQRAWMTAQIEGELAAADDLATAHRFESAWIATYEKIDDRWMMVGISSSVVERS